MNKRKNLEEENDGCFVRIPILIIIVIILLLIYNRGYCQIDSFFKNNQWYFCYQPKTDAVRDFKPHNQLKLNVSDTITKINIHKVYLTINEHTYKIFFTVSSKRGLPETAYGSKDIKLDHKPVTQEIYDSLYKWTPQFKNAYIYFEVRIWDGNKWGMCILASKKWYGAEGDRVDSMLRENYKLLK